jgi:hypothetical protein
MRERIVVAALLATAGPVGGRGVNSIQLYNDGHRWWITSWMYDGRADAPEVPAAYLPDSEAGS